MIEFNPKKFKTPPFAHQLDGVKALLKNKSFALFDEMGAGKSKQVIDAACSLADGGVITLVVVVAPASVRCVWTDPEIGEIKKHAWISSSVYDFHSKVKLIWGDGIPPIPSLCWIVTNYEFLRQPARLQELLKVVETGKTLLVLDEGSYIKSRTAKQTKAIEKLRAACDRCVLLNGTPVTDSPLDLWAQMKVLDKNILGKKYANFYHFRANYAQMGGWHMKQVVKFFDLDKLSKMIAPHVLRREKKDCLDLPEKLYTFREVPLSLDSWKRYKELKKDAIINMGNGEMQLEPNAAVRIMRLSQLTSGLLGTPASCVDPDDLENITPAMITDVSDEKLNWAVKYLTEECTAKAVIVWTRWRRERERLFAALQGHSIYIYQIYGGQPRKERDQAVQSFSVLDREFPKNKNVLIAQPHAGGFGLNLVTATEAIYLSNDYSLGVRLQSEDRCHRPGQVHPVLYTDVIATGPAGQRTVDHAIVKALREKQDIARWTVEKWRKELSDD